MNNIIERIWKQGGLVNIEDLRGTAFQAEESAHTFRIRGVDESGEPLALTGTCAAIFLRADNTDVAITGTITDGAAEITLTDECYDMPGRFGLTIYVTSDEQTVAVYAAIGSVCRTSSGTVSPETGEDVMDLINAIAEAVATIPASYTDMMAAVAPTYSTSALYAVGSYAWYSGKLYRCTTAITSGETWTSAHWTQANLGSDVSDIKSALSEELGIELTITNGIYYNTAGTTTSHSNYQTSVIQYNGIDDIYVTTNANSVARIAVYFNGEPSASTKIGQQDADYPASYGTLSVTNYKLTIPTGTKYIAINNIKNAGTLSAKRDTVEYANQQVAGILGNLSDVDDALYAYVNETSGLTIISGEYYRVGGDLYEHQDYETTVISISTNEHYKVTCAGNSLCPCVMYFNGTPSSSTLISYEPTSYPESYGTKVVTGYEVTIPANAKYMVVNNRPNDADLTVWKKQIAEVSETMLSYQGKNILLLGDSITQLNLTSRGWPKYFSQIVKPARMDNVAVIGAHWCDYNNSTVYNGDPQADSTEQNVVGNQVQKIINNPSDYAESYDVIIIAAGTNDPTSTGEISTSDINAQFFSGSSVKELNDVDRSTWPGATRWITEKLRGLFPTATIIFNTPIHRIDLHDSSRVLNNGACVKRCADVNGVLLCETLHCGITMTDESYFSDLLHPSAKGAKLIGAYNAKFFANMFTGYIDE